MATKKKKHKSLLSKMKRKAKRLFCLNHLIPATCFFIGCLLFLSQITWSSSSGKLIFSTGSVLELKASPALADAHQASWKFFHPIWQDSKSTFPFPNHPLPNEGLKNALGKLQSIIKDPDNRIEPAFQVPDYLSDRVLFWMLVHTEFSRRLRIIHDRNNPSIIYGYIDYRPLYNQLGISKTLEKRIAKVDRQIRLILAKRLLEAADVSPKTMLTDAERDQMRTFLSKIGALGEKQVRALTKNIRSQTGQEDEFYLALHRSRQLLPHIESVFQHYKLPKSLARIPFVESSFNAQAHSKVGAMGIWQFMPRTARELIHKSNTKLWSDPIAQTRGAAKLLRNYRSVLPDWGTTITSYHSGVGRVSKLLKKRNMSGYQELINLPEKKGGLGFAGINFYSQFLSANLVEAYRKELFGSFILPKEAPAIIKGIIPFAKEVCEFEK